MHDESETSMKVYQDKYYLGRAKTKELCIEWFFRTSPDQKRMEDHPHVLQMAAVVSSTDLGARR